MKDFIHSSAATMGQSLTLDLRRKALGTHVLHHLLHHRACAGGLIIPKSSALYFRINPLHRFWLGAAAAGGAATGCWGCGAERTSLRAGVSSGGVIDVREGGAEVGTGVRAVTAGAASSDP